MTVDSVREVAIGDDWELPPREASAEEIRIETESVESPEKRFEGYAFEGQDVVKGTYEYESNPMFGSPKTATGSFQLRKESGLVIIRMDDDQPHPESIFQSLDDVINGNTEIQEHFVPKRQRVWDFINAAYQKGEIKVLPPYGEVTSAAQIDVDEETLREYPIETAELVFEYEGNEVVVAYSDDRLSIKTDDNANREYVLQVFESKILGDR
ncbi:hypothetical protein DMJ13_20130 [halophilic archaeon]|nr:hypothetical protein DMJ13_20130 [halophilic archaeon]